MSTPAEHPGLPVTLPAGTPSWITGELLEHTIRVWSPRYGRELTPDEALQIMMSVGELHRALSGAAQDAAIRGPGQGEQS